MGESLVAWKLAYLLNGGTNDLTETTLSRGTDSYEDFDSKIGNHVSSWNDQRLNLEIANGINWVKESKDGFYVKINSRANI